jgi:predicted alpha/beta-hydrolase family hydrolase
MPAAKAVTIAVKDTTVSALWQNPPGAKAALVLAHGAGAGMTNKSMVAIADGLGQRSIATLRFNFLYMERGSKRPDAPPLAHAAIRAAVAYATKLAPKLPLFAGGKSFGGRMTSQAQALEPLANVRGLIFFGFPLHPAGAPGIERAAHLDDVALPMLFLSGTADALADLKLLKKVVARLGKRATLELAAHADHSFHAPARTGLKDADILATLLDTAAAWMRKHS